MSGKQATPSREQLAALVFELASQLHVERAERLALQTALLQAGVIDSAALVAQASNPDLALGSRAALEESIARLMRVIKEGANS